MSQNSRQGSDLVEVTVVEHLSDFDTKDAYCVTMDEAKFGTDQKKIWLPKSQVEQADVEQADYDYTTFFIPEWLAIDKGLV